MVEVERRPKETIFNQREIIILQKLLEGEEKELIATELGVKEKKFGEEIQKIQKTFSEQVDIGSQDPELSLIIFYAVDKGWLNTSSLPKDSKGSCTDYQKKVLIASILGDKPDKIVKDLGFSDSRSVRDGIHNVLNKLCVVNINQAAGLIACRKELLPDIHDAITKVFPSS